MPIYTTRKYDGDDQFSWAVFKSKDVKGMRGVIFYGEASPIVCGLSRNEANYHKKSLELKESKGGIMMSKKESNPLPPDIKNKPSPPPAKRVINEDVHLIKLIKGVKRMGLEKHVDSILFNDPNVFREDYGWNNGLYVYGSNAIVRKIRALKIMKALDKSHELGKTSFDEETRKIEFEPMKE